MGEKNDEKDLSFIKETRVEKPVNKKKVFRKIIGTLGLAILFGLVASLMIAVVAPWLADFYEKTRKPFVYRVFEEGEDLSEITVTIQPSEDIKNDEPKDDTSNEGNAVVDTQPQENTNVNLPSDEELTPEEEARENIREYQEVLDSLYTIGREADSFVVTVTGVTNGTGLFNDTTQSQGTGCGTIFLIDDKELLILTEKSAVMKANSLLVTFNDDTTASAELLGFDDTTGVALLSVDTDNLSEDTLNNISAAKLGSSYGIKTGQIVLAVGSPLGTIHSVLIGNITYEKNVVSLYDGNYTCFTTDMVASTKPSGVLINTDSEIVGMVLPEITNAINDTTICAVSISELKSVIEVLSNGGEIPYVGIKGNTVTDSVSAQYSIPKGLYVKEVEFNSPAMDAGIQSGDVITSLNDEEISSETTFKRILKSLKEGDEVTVGYMRAGRGDYSYIESTLTIK